MASESDIQPFTIAIPDSDLADLHDRLARTRWPQELPGIGWERGIPTDYLRPLADYWRDGYDWRRHEAQLNELPQFTTTIDGQPIHFLHVRSPEPDALPLVITHGFPSCPVEFLRVIGPLTDPVAHGGDAADAFHLVLPSLPGYGFSTPVVETGWGNLFRVAQAWATLMERLGYDRYAVYGTDVGAGVADLLGMVAPDHVAASYVTGTAVAPPFGPPIELDGLSDADRVRAERFNDFQDNGAGYLHMQSTRPQTLSYGLTDSPVGQLAWLVDRIRELSAPGTDAPEEAVDRDQMLTIVSIYWFTASGDSTAHGTYEGMKAWREIASGEAHGDWDAPPAPPRGIGVFAGDTTIRSLFDPDGAFEHWTEFEVGGHYPAMETPDLLVDDLRAFLRSHR